MRCQLVSGSGRRSSPFGVVQSIVAQHRAKCLEQTVTDAAQRLYVSFAMGLQSLILVFANRIALAGDIGPMIQCVLHQVVRRPALTHDCLLT